ncbi:MAG: hypothetical protein GC181_04870 [Bacteroidetes bacterium]|nr:hypothetical protein [Bacteroidota bacterium]
MKFTFKLIPFAAFIVVAMLFSACNKTPVNPGQGDQEHKCMMDGNHAKCGGTCGMEHCHEGGHCDGKEACSDSTKCKSKSACGDSMQSKHHHGHMENMGNMMNDSVSGN